MSDLLKIQEVNFETALIEHLQALGYETLLGSDIDRQSEWLFLFIGTALLKHWDGGFLKIGTEA